MWGAFLVRKISQIRFFDERNFCKNMGEKKEKALFPYKSAFVRENICKFLGYFFEINLKIVVKTF